MARIVQIFNPVHLQKVKTARLNVMGRVLNGKRQQISVYLNNILIRKVTPSPNGSFECRLDLEKLSESQKHVVEIRVASGFGTERIMIPFTKVLKSVVAENTKKDETTSQKEECSSDSAES